MSGRSASIAPLDIGCAEERDCLLFCALSAETRLQLKIARCAELGDIPFKIRQGQEANMTVVQYDSPLNVAQAKQALLEENKAGLAPCKKKAAQNEWAVTSN